MSQRTAQVQRQTNETQIGCSVNLDGTGASKITTGIGFLDHMVVTLSKLSRIDIELTCQGDLYVDDHHTTEDCALALGQCIDKALGDRRGIARFGDAHAPLDEALARAVIDLSGRPYPQIDLGLKREKLGDLSCEMIGHFFISLAIALRASLHVDVLKGMNDHHRCEAAFKAVGLALRNAVAKDGDEILSTKGVL
jgi:imidazoleglycerol-phosphate dehydratase